MKIAIVEHLRCDEPLFMRTIVWIPDEMTPEQFEASVDAARDEYLAFAESFKNAEPPNDYQQYSQPPTTGIRR